MANGLDQVQSNLDKYTADFVSKGERAMQAVCAALEGWAKVEHPYTDRTGNNTNSIRAFVAEVTPTVIRGALTASMEYSVFLELARQGKWAFLMPVLERHKQDILKILQEEFAR